jgi:hypothetical protein
MTISRGKGREEGRNGWTLFLENERVLITSYGNCLKQTEVFIGGRKKGSSSCFVLKRKGGRDFQLSWMDTFVTTVGVVGVVGCC